MDQRFLVISILLWGCVIGSNDDDKCDYEQNGCSTGIHLPYKTDFKPACNKHDVCYSCGAYHGFSRYECDSRFYYGMEEICKHHERWCYMWKYLYYFFVRMFGGNHYHGNDPKYDCHSAKVNDCLKR